MPTREPPAQYRAEFDAAVTFSNGGALRVEGFRVDLPGPEVTDAQVAALFVASLGLLMTEHVELSHRRVFAEPHKGTRGGPSDSATVDGVRNGSQTRRLVELSHVIGSGLPTYPRPSRPVDEPHVTGEGSRAADAPGTEVAIDRISVVGNRGTRLHAEGDDLRELPLSSIADLPAVVVRTAGSETRAVDVGALAAFDVRGKAVLLHTSGDGQRRTSQSADSASYLTAEGAQWLVDRHAALVGIDSLDIDDSGDPSQPALTILLGAGIPVVEHLTGLEQLPPYGARFTAAPPLLAQFGTFPVRAFAVVS